MTNSVGNQTTSTAPNLVYVDTLAPSVTIAVTPTTSGGFNLGWSGSDATAWVLNYDVQSREGASDTWLDVLSDTPLTATSVNGKVGYPYYFRVRAEDRAGNISGWVQAGPYSITRLATKYYLFGSQRVAMRRGNVVYYLHSDHLGSTSLTTDVNGNVVSQARYLPYGETRWGGLGQTDFGFTSQRQEGFGLYDYNARYYSPVLGRFISPDTVVPGMPALTIGIADSANSETKAIPSVLNRYAYVSNNPIIGTDPDGHCFPVCTAVIGALIGGAAMGIGYAANQYITGQEINLVETLAAVGTGMAAGALVGSGVGIVAAGATGATLTTAATLTGAGMGMAGAGGGNIVSNIITGNEFDTQNFLVTSAYGGVAGALAPHYGTSVVGAMSINGLANVATYETTHYLDNGSLALDGGTAFSLGTGMVAGFVSGPATRPTDITMFTEWPGKGYIDPGYVATEVIDNSIGGSNLIRVPLAGTVASSSCDGLQICD